MTSWQNFRSYLQSLSLRPISGALLSAITGKILALLVVAFVLFKMFPDWGPKIAALFEHPHDGLIIVNSPTVYTRQRLVNDRLAQTAWLKDQLEITSKGHEKDFRGIDLLSVKERRF